MPLEFGPYRVMRSLGRGASGEVFEVVHGETGAHYALKALASFQDADDAARFQREAEAMARLDHPNVARIHGADLSAAQPYLVQEFLSGGDLAARIERGPLPVAEAVRITIALAEGLSAVHGQGILHRDLKPENVLLDASGTPKLVDFGIARLTDRTKLTETHALLGTPSYMSPEQAQGIGVGERSDVYSLAGLLYALLVGHPPFQALGSVLALLNAVLTQPPPAPSKARAEVPAWLDKLVLAGLSKDPSLRPAGAREFGAALQLGPPPASKGTPLAWGAAVGALLLLAISGYALKTSSAEATPSPTPTRVQASRPPPDQPAPVPSPLSRVVLRRWSLDNATSAWLFDDRHLVAFDREGRAVELPLRERGRLVREPLFELPKSKVPLDHRRSTLFLLEHDSRGWFAVVGGLPPYRYNLKKPLFPLTIERVIVSWKGTLFFSSSDESFVHQFDTGLSKFSLPSAPGENPPTFEGALVLPDDRGLLLMTPRQLFVWKPGSKPEPLAAPMRFGDYNSIALSPDGKLLYLGTRDGVVTWRPFGEGAEADWSSLRGPSIKLSAHVWSVLKIVPTPEAIYTIASSEIQIRVHSWDPSSHALQGVFKTDHPGGGAVNLAVGPGGKQLAMGLTSGGVELFGVSDFEDPASAGALPTPPTRDR